MKEQLQEQIAKCEAFIADMKTHKTRLDADLRYAKAQLKLFKKQLSEYAETPLQTLEKITKS